MIMRLLRVTLIAAVGLGGGAAWLMATRPAAASAAGDCASCQNQTCVAGAVDSTCVSGVYGGHPWCQSTSGCIGTPTLRLCPPPSAP